MCSDLRAVQRRLVHLHTSLYLSIDPYVCIRVRRLVAFSFSQGRLSPLCPFREDLLIFLSSPRTNLFCISSYLWTAQAEKELLQARKNQKSAKKVRRQEEEVVWLDAFVTLPSRTQLFTDDRMRE